MIRASGLIVVAALSCGQVLAAGASEPAPKAAAPVEFVYKPQGVFAVVAAPGRLTDIALEPGETLVETNPIAAGDTARWIIGDTASGTGEGRRVHILVKPTAPGLSTNLVVNTTRRTYFLELRASARGYLTQVRWRYPQPVAITAPAATQPLSTPRAAPRLYFGYAVSGPARLRPARVFDDGARTFVDFGGGARAQLPPLFLIGPDGRSELAAYRVEAGMLVVDRIFERAELRLGSRRKARRVLISRLGPSGQEAAR